MSPVLTNPWCCRAGAGLLARPPAPPPARPRPRPRVARVRAHRDRARGRVPLRHARLQRSGPAPPSPAQAAAVPRDEEAAAAAGGRPQVLQLRQLVQQLQPTVRSGDRATKRNCMKNIVNTNTDTPCRSSTPRTTGRWPGAPRGRPACSTPGRSPARRSAPTGSASPPAFSWDRWSYCLVRPVSDVWCLMILHI